MRVGRSLYGHGDLGLNKREPVRGGGGGQAGRLNLCAAETINLSREQTRYM